MEKHPRASLVVLWLHFCWASSINQVEQSPPSLIILEGENGTLQCNYTMSPFNNLRWYRQDAGRGPVSLIIMSNAESRKSKGRYTATLDTARKRSSLHIRAAQLSDRAVYICVLLLGRTSLLRLLRQPDNGRQSHSEAAGQRSQDLQLIVF
ncbi:T cell receptor alpha variable 10 [Manis javanica]|nr:T cell receptor alpha variable 10 [Manis javanica]